MTTIIRASGVGFQVQASAQRASDQQLALDTHMKLGRTKPTTELERGNSGDTTVAIVVDVGARADRAPSEADGGSLIQRSGIAPHA